MTTKMNETKVFDQLENFGCSLYNLLDELEEYEILLKYGEMDYSSMKKTFNYTYGNLYNKYTFLKKMANKIINIIDDNEINNFNNDFISQLWLLKNKLFLEVN